MSPELEKKLFEKYPQIFHRGADFRSISGLDVGDGWFNLIDSLCAVIQSRVDTRRCMLNEANSADISDVRATQVKEKWGGLRFYISGGDDFIWGAIMQAEIMSHKICEQCGKPGVKRHSGWVMTLCEEHASLKPSN